MQAHSRPSSVWDRQPADVQKPSAFIFKQDVSGTAMVGTMKPGMGNSCCRETTMAVDAVAATYQSSATYERV